MISQRTKAALAAVKARGVKLGNPRVKAGDRAAALRAAEAKKGIARRRSPELMPFIEAAEKAGCVTLGQIAEALMARGIKRPGGGGVRDATAVRRVVARARKSGL